MLSAIGAERRTGSRAHHQYCREWKTGRRRIPELAIRRVVIQALSLGLDHADKLEEIRDFGRKNNFGNKRDRQRRSVCLYGIASCDPDANANRDAVRGLSLLHDFAGEDVELSVFLLANFGDLKRARFVAAHGRSLRGRSVAGGKLDDD